MQDWVEKLISLQDKDVRIVTLQEQIDSAPGEKQRATEMLSGAEAGVKQAREGIQEHEKALKVLEMDAQEVEEKKRSFQSKTVMIKDNMEYRAALTQIEEYRGHINKLEDQELAIMEEIEAAREDLAAKQRDLKAAQARVNEMLSDLDTRVANSTTEIARVKIERDAVRAEIPPDVVSRYERLMGVPSRGRSDRRVFVPVRDNVCDRCHMSVTAQMRNDARKAVCVSCQYCGALLYWDA